LLANSAPHTRHRAVRVMMAVMVLGQHERLKLRDGTLRVNSENSIRVIGFADNRSGSRQRLVDNVVS